MHSGRSTFPALPLDEAPPFLEDWYRQFLSKAAIDISSSGVEPYRFGPLRKLLKISARQMDSLTLQDWNSFGGETIRRVIAERYASGDVSRVMVTHGSSEAISLLLHVLVRRVDQVAVADPIYHSLHTIPELQGCEVVRVPVASFTDHEDGSNGALEQLRPGIRAVIVNFPHNPTGVSLRPEETERLIAPTSNVSEQ